jgi:phosphoribosylpyrophosphate synthetase
MQVPDVDFAFIIESRELVGSVAGRDVIISEDIIDTGATLERAAKELRRQGAKSIAAFATHGMYIVLYYSVVYVEHCILTVLCFVILYRFVFTECIGAHI